MAATAELSAVPTMRTPTLLLLLLTIACGTAHKPAAPSAPTLSDAQWRVIDARDHRDGTTLCGLLRDTSANVRAAAALAFASVGDSSGVPCLLHALSDADARVRCNAAFAFGFCGDSATVFRLIERFAPEENAAVRGRIAEAVGRCGRSNGARALPLFNLSTKADSLGVLRGLFFATTTNSTDTSLVRYALSLYTARDAELDEAALQVSARSRADLVKPCAKRLLAIAMTIPDSGYTDLRLPLLASLGKTADKDALIRLKEALENDVDPRMRVMALRGMGPYDRKDTERQLWNALEDSIGMVRDEALAQVLAWKDPVDGVSAWTMAQEHSDYRIKIPLYGLAMKYGDEGTRTTCGMLMESMAKQDLGPYLNAALYRARAVDRQSFEQAFNLDSILPSKRSEAEKQAAFEAALEPPRSYIAKRSDVPLDRPLDKLARFYEERHEAHWAALRSGDPGLIANAIERLLDEDKAMLTPPDTIKADLIAIRSSLRPIRDLEAIQDLDKAIAKRDGQPAPPHRSPPFNHPIDRSRLAALKPGQQYRITTGQGDIILALEPEAAPGSCVAFDSLVTAGFYNGKYFHRVVPDFVAQGGCPRGDGYGAMDWTLRTEVSLDGFTTGAVGLASAGKDTESCQFFIMLADTPHLDGRYTRFAHVVSGMEVAWRLRVGDRMLSVERVQ